MAHGENGVEREMLALTRKDIISTGEDHTTTAALPMAVMPSAKSHPMMEED